jgi:hypothetical protein
VRPLTEHELKFYADPARDSVLHEIVVNGTRTQAGPDGKVTTKPSRLLGKVWYMKIYGETGVIYENLVFNFT